MTRFIIIIVLTLASKALFGQNQEVNKDTIQPDTIQTDSVKAEKFNPDSTRYYYLDEDSILFAEIVQLNPILIFHKQYPTAREQSRFNYTKRVVGKVWPYYISALKNMAEVDLDLIDVKRRRKRKKIVKRQQKELKLEFEDELRKLTVTEGKTLIKMIERKTDMPFYDLIKDYRGTLEAFKWNTLAFTLGYSLRDGYDPIEWEYLEVIMDAIESY